MDAIADNRTNQTKLKKINLRQPMVPQVYAAMRACIINLDWKPGEIVAKDEIAATLGVSQAPVREALLKLEADGLVVVVPRSRTVVSAIDLRHAVEAQFLRLSVEIEVARTIAGYDDASADLADIARLLTHQEIFATHGALAEFAASDDEFHVRLCALAGVGGLWSLVNARRSHIDRLRHLDLPSRGKLEKVLRDHRRIIDALQAGDAAEAEAAVRAHLSGTLGNAERLKAEFPEFFRED
jgi:DNA-binding GntR family transcriptional regulator